MSLWHRLARVFVGTFFSELTTGAKVTFPFPSNCVQTVTELDCDVENFFRSPWVVREGGAAWGSVNNLCGQNTYIQIPSLRILGYLASTHLDFFLCTVGVILVGS